MTRLMAGIASVAARRFLVAKTNNKKCILLRIINVLLALLIFPCIFFGKISDEIK